MDKVKVFICQPHNDQGNAMQYGNKINCTAFIWDFDWFFLLCTRLESYLLSNFKWNSNS